LPWLLRLAALIEFVYFSLSHWFAPELFFTNLGIPASEVASPFVRSQLQLIGVFVAGFSLLNLMVAGDPPRYKAVMAIVLAVGAGAVAIFIGNVCAGLLPGLFLANALLLSIQIALVAWMFPWRIRS
jgi:hypothetical protein